MNELNGKIKQIEEDCSRLSREIKANEGINHLYKDAFVRITNMELAADDLNRFHKIVENVCDPDLYLSDTPSLMRNDSLWGRHHPIICSY